MSSISTPFLLCFRALGGSPSASSPLPATWPAEQKAAGSSGRRGEGWRGEGVRRVGFSPNGEGLGPPGWPILAGSSSSEEKKRKKKANGFPLASASPKQTACPISFAVREMFLLKVAISHAHKTRGFRGSRGVFAAGGGPWARFPRPWRPRCPRASARGPTSAQISRAFFPERMGLHWTPRPGGSPPRKVPVEDGLSPGSACGHTGQPQPPASPGASVLLLRNAGLRRPEQPPGQGRHGAV